MKDLFGELFEAEWIYLFHKLFLFYKIDYIFSSSWELGFDWVLDSLLIGKTYDFQLFNLSIIGKSKTRPGSC